MDILEKASTASISPKSYQDRFHYTKLSPSTDKIPVVTPVSTSFCYTCFWQVELTVPFYISN